MFKWHVIEPKREAYDNENRSCFRLSFCHTTQSLGPDCWAPLRLIPSCKLAVAHLNPRQRHVAIRTGALSCMTKGEAETRSIFIIVGFSLGFTDMSFWHLNAVCLMSRWCQSPIISASLELNWEGMDDLHHSKVFWRSSKVPRRCAFGNECVNLCAH